MHAEYTIRAARAGVHVLCEKPMAITVDECQAMIDACREHRVKLMVAYRLHFEEINLGVIDLVRKGRIGIPNRKAGSVCAGTVVLLSFAVARANAWEPSPRRGDDVSVVAADRVEFLWKFPSA